MAQDEPQVVWCGRKLEGQDVSIRLVPSQIGIWGRTLAVVKVHSSRLGECSKYFATCMSERWAQPNPNDPASREFELEVHGELQYYINCFHRMYTPLLKFQNVKHSLKFLQVATQIEYEAMMSSICRYLSSTRWSDEDELAIRQFKASSLFPLSHAKDLIARLEMPGSEDDRREQIRCLIKRCMRSIHNEDVNNPASNFFIEFCKVLVRQQQSISSTFESDVVEIINNEVKRMLVDLHEECDGQSIHQVPGFVPKLRAIHRLLEALLMAELAEEGVECFLHLERYPQVLADAAASRFEPEVQVLAKEFALLILVMYGAVILGSLVLGIPDRVALLKNWHALFLNFQHHLTEEVKAKTAHGLFCTLPFEQQMELLEDEDHIHWYINPSELATALKEWFPAAE